MIVVFDLDDTLYPEQRYAESGMAAVAAMLAQRAGVDRAGAEAALRARLERGRDGVFDDVLPTLGLRGQAWVQRALACYRSHAPTLTLHADATRCLDRLAHLPLYLVTDGNARVQERKIAALGLRARMRRCLVTHRYGVAHAKPSPHCFLRICALERVAPQRVLYIGDNPRKDFKGIRPLGFRTLRVRRGMFAALELDAAHEAEASTPDLDLVTPAWLATLAAPPENA